MSQPQRIVNVADLAFHSIDNDKGFQARSAGPRRCSGSRGWAAPLIVPPGKRAWPFHRHHVANELFYILSGSGEVRLDDRTLPVRAGDLIANPAGAEAHQIVNTGASELRYLAISDVGAVDIIEYPNSEKVAMAAGVRNADLSTATYKAIGRVAPADYWDGESGDADASFSICP